MKALPAPQPWTTWDHAKQMPIIVYTPLVKSDIFSEEYFITKV